MIILHVSESGQSEDSPAPCQSKKKMEYLLLDLYPDSSDIKQNSNLLSFCPGAAGHSIRGFLYSRVICDWQQLISLGLSEAQISSVSTALFPAQHTEKWKKGVFQFTVSITMIACLIAILVYWSFVVGVEVSVASSLGELPLMLTLPVHKALLPSSTLHTGQMVLSRSGI